MRRHVLTAVLLSFAASLILATAGAQAVVVDMKAVGQSSVPFNGSDRSGYVGVSMVAGTEGNLAAQSVPVVSSSGQCQDPALPPDLILPRGGLCWHGGAVMHRNETFAFTWDPGRSYWQTTRDFMEQFLGDVASGSGTFTSPYAITGGYSDASGRAANTSLYGGGCIDFGNVGGSACKFGDISGSGPGHGYGTGGCDPATGASYGSTSNSICLTDAQVQTEIKTMIAQTGMLGRVTRGYTPLVVMLTPTGVETCLDAGARVCSANSNAAAKFCSYHSQVNVGGTEVGYVVQPWTPYTSCDEPDVPDLSAHPTAQEISVDAGRRLASPLSRSMLGAIVNPGLNGWFANTNPSTPAGSEIGDNGCQPAPKTSGLDTVVVGTSNQNPYWLQREFDNSGLIQSDPNSPECAAGVTLSPAFVVPSSVNPGDLVDFDGSATASSMIVPKTGYVWTFGDGTTSVGPSVTHTYKSPGTYSVKLTVTDRGGNVRSLAQPIVVLGTRPPGGGASFRAHIALLPQSLRSVLRHGVAAKVSSNRAADAIVTLAVSRRVAQRAHIKAGRARSVIVGRGTISSIKKGTTMLHLRVSRRMAARLRHIKHLELTVRLTLYAAGGSHVPVVAAGRY